MAADLTNPFGPSCCEAGGECGPMSAQSCGCDPGLKPKPWVCQRHQTEARMKELFLKAYLEEKDKA